MKKEFPEKENTRRWWMILYLDITMILLTLFVFLTTFTEQNPEKVEIFKKFFRKSLFMEGSGKSGAESLADIHQGDPLKAILNRMKSEGINETLMQRYLTLNQIKDLKVMAGSQGVVVVLPEVVLFEENQTEFKKRSLRFLSRISFLVSELPYLVEIRGYSDAQYPSEFRDALEFSAVRAMKVYDFFIKKGIYPPKLKVSGVGDAYSHSGIAQDKVEIIFKDIEL